MEKTERWRNGWEEVNKRWKEGRNSTHIKTERRMERKRDI